MRCSECEKKIPEGDKFCPNCGTKAKGKKQPDAADEPKKIKTLQARIDYLEELLDDESIDYDKAEDES